MDVPINLDTIQANEYKTTDGALFMSALTTNGEVEVFINQDIMFMAAV